MHEMSLAVALLERVLAEADEGGLRSVNQVSVELGSLQAVEPDLLVEAFRAAALNGPAEGAPAWIWNFARPKPAAKPAARTSNPATRTMSAPSAAKPM